MHKPGSQGNCIRAITKLVREALRASGQIDKIALQYMYQACQNLVHANDIFYSESEGLGKVRYIFWALQMQKHLSTIYKQIYLPFCLSDLKKKVGWVLLSKSWLDSGCTAPWLQSWFRLTSTYSNILYYTSHFINYILCNLCEDLGKAQTGNKLKINVLKQDGLHDARMKSTYSQNQWKCKTNFRFFICKGNA